MALSWLSSLCAHVNSARYGSMRTRLNLGRGRLDLTMAWVDLARSRPGVDLTSHGPGSNQNGTRQTQHGHESTRLDRSLDRLSSTWARTDSARLWFRPTRLDWTLADSALPGSGQLDLVPGRLNLTWPMPTWLCSTWARAYSIVLGLRQTEFNLGTGRLGST